MMNCLVKKTLNEIIHVAFIDQLKSILDEPGLSIPIGTNPPLGKGEAFNPRRAGHEVPPLHVPRAEAGNHGIPLRNDWAKGKIRKITWQRVHILIQHITYYDI